ncbi:hypothetical protein GSI_11012 [Ganoderma sinense ZZ0214-1]|uniref:WW domain-containing protein n=1 Tax=Ganoderma sinense ZZ0214-1 TaxID=1077348 RepID=A0A2G8S2T6_9APHY|nr:hypothetical protein GSI_11012 [Ganoderma sinense ZZ0214-1]
MADDDGERLDWGNDDDEQQAPPGSTYDYSPRQSTYIGAIEDAEDAEDAVSLGGDDEDEREYYATHSAEQVSAAGTASFSKPPSSASHGGRRDSQRQAATLSRTPSRAQNSQSPTRDSRPPNSQGKPPPLLLVHGLPPKPTLVPPLFEQPAETGTRASAMANRRRANGKVGAGDGDDPLPPDWEVRYPRTGGQDVYYYNTKTDESTWTRPHAPTSGQSSPTKNGGPQTSDPHSPEIMDNGHSEARGRSQQPRIARRDTDSRRASPPPNQDLSYSDRHYRPGEAPAATPATNPDHRRGERGVTGPGYYPEATYVQGRSPSPQPVNDGKRRTRSSSPQWDRRARRDLSPISSQDRATWRDGRGEYSQETQAGGSDSSWGRSQEYPQGMQSVTRSPPARRNRRKDDIEPHMRRKDDIEPPIRRKDDVEPRIRRKDDVEPRVEPRTRRRDDFEPRIRRKDDIEPPFRRKDHLEPSLPPRDQSSRHADEWAAPSTRPRSPPPPLREPSTAYPVPTSSSTREPPRYARSSSPPPPRPSGRYRDNHGNDGLPQRRGRDADIAEQGFDTKRRRLNDDVPPRRGPHELPSTTTSLPTKPGFVNSYPPGEQERENQHRKRPPLPPQSEHWKTSSQGPPTTQGVTPPSNDVNTGESLSFEDTLAFLGFNPVNEIPGDGRSFNDHFIRLFERDPNNKFFAPPMRPRPRNTMDVDVPPPPRNDHPGRSSIGGMYSDRMSGVPAPDAAPRAPRAMVPRDSAVYTSGPSSLSPTSPYGTRPGVPPVVDQAGPPPGHGGRSRPNPGPPMGNRRWDPSDLGRQNSFAGPSPIDRQMDLPPPPPPKRSNDMSMSRNLPERPPPRAPDVPQRGMGRAPPPPHMTGTNSIPIGPRTAAYDGPPPLDPQPSFRQTSNDHESYRPPQKPDRVNESSDSYSKRIRYSRDEPVPEPRPRSDRVDRRPSVSTAEPSRRGVVDSPVDDRAPSRQKQMLRVSGKLVKKRGDKDPVRTKMSSRANPKSKAGIPASASSVTDTFLSFPDRVPRDERPAWRHPSPPRDGPVKRPKQFEEHHHPRRPFPQPQPAPRAPPDVPPRSSRALTPPRPPADRRDEEPMLPERSAPGKVHPDRARLLDPNEKPSTSKPVRIRRPAKSPERGYTERIPEDTRARNLPPKPDDARIGTSMGPPPARERSPPPPPPALQNGNGYRPHVKRATSLLERLNVHEHEEMASSSLRDRVQAVDSGSSRLDPAMMMDVDGGFGDEGKGRGSVGSRRRGAPPKRRGTGRRNGP